MRLHRLISILLLIENKGTLKAKELADKFEISTRTVYRDIEDLCAAGIPIVTTTGPNGGITLMEGYSGGIKSMQEDDIINLFLGGLGIQPHQSSDTSVKLNNALLKLQKNLPRKQETTLENIGRRFYFDSTPWWGDSFPLSYIDLLIHSIVNNEILKILYKNNNGQESERDVYPYGMVVKRMDWYLVGYCMKSKSMRIFNCQRISKCFMKGETFLMPDGFSIEAFWNKQKDAFKKLCAENEKYPVTLKINKHKMDMLEGHEIYSISDYTENGIIDVDFAIVTLNMYQQEYAIDKILENLQCFKVLYPTDLREKVKNMLTNILEQYC